MSYGAWITETAIWRIRRVNLNKALNLAIGIMKEEGFNPDIKLGEVFWQGETIGKGKEKRAPIIRFETYLSVANGVPTIGLIHVYVSSFSSERMQAFRKITSRLKKVLFEKGWLLPYPVQRPSIMRPKTRASRQ